MSTSISAASASSRLIFRSSEIIVVAMYRRLSSLRKTQKPQTIIPQTRQSTVLLMPDRYYRSYHEQIYELVACVNQENCHFVARKHCGHKSERQSKTSPGEQPELQPLHKQCKVKVTRNNCHR